MSRDEWENAARSILMLARLSLPAHKPKIDELLSTFEFDANEEIVERSLRQEVVEWKDKASFRKALAEDTHAENVRLRKVLSENGIEVDAKTAGRLERIDMDMGEVRAETTETSGEGERKK